MARENTYRARSTALLDGQAPTGHGRGAGDRPKETCGESDLDVTLERLETANAVVVLEHGPAGTMGRIDAPLDGFYRAYGGPLDEATQEAFREVAVEREVIRP